MTDYLTTFNASVIKTPARFLIDIKNVISKWIRKAKGQLK